MLLASICALLFADAQAKEKSMPPLEVVPSVDLGRYAGTWYEIARLPNWFQKQCTGRVSATYTLLDDGTIRVVNSCQKANGEITQAEGRAKPADRKGPNTKLKVRFAPKLLSLLPFVWGDYWILDLAEDYNYAVVGEPSRKYLWVLSRTPTMDDMILKDVLDGVQKQGYDLSSLIRTQQSVE